MFEHVVEGEDAPVNPPAGGNNNGNANNVPKTGDNSPVAMYAVSLVAALAVILKRKSIFAR